MKQALVLAGLLHGGSLGLLSPPRGHPPMRWCRINRAQTGKHFLLPVIPRYCIAPRPLLGTGCAGRGDGSGSVSKHPDQPDGEPPGDNNRAGTNKVIFLIRPLSINRTVDQIIRAQYTLWRSSSTTISVPAFSMDL